MQSLFDASTPGVPHFVYTDHTHLENRHYSTSRQHNLYSPRWIALEREVYRNAALTLVSSSNVRRSLMDEYEIPAEKVVLVYAGSNADIRPMEKASGDYTQKEILFVGLDWKRKGGPDLAEAFKPVLEKCPTARLTIVGAAPELHIPNCEVVGKVPPEELDRFYQRASAFCLPTYLEPFGIVFIEAMIARLPIVATRVGAIPDFVEASKNGWLVEPGDIHGLADALLKLLQDPHVCQAFGKHSYQLVRDRYSWKAVGKRYEENILNVLGHTLALKQEKRSMRQEML